MSIEDTIRAHVEKRDAEKARVDAERMRRNQEEGAKRLAAIEEKRQQLLYVLEAVVALVLSKLEQTGPIYTGVALSKRFTRRIRPLGFLPWLSIHDARNWPMWVLEQGGSEVEATLVLRSDGTIWQFRKPEKSDEGDGPLSLMKRFVPLYSSLHTPGFNDLTMIYRRLRDWAIPHYGDPLITEDEIRPLEFPVRDESLREALGMKPGGIKKQSTHQ